jgi:hypothetical protein
MNRITLLISIVTVSVIGFSTIEKKEISVEEQYFILHYTPGPEWNHEKAPNEQARFTGHSQFLSSIRASGRAIIGGRYANKGMIIFTARDQAEADSLFSTDPSVEYGTFTAEIYPISFFYKGTIE